MELLLEAHQIPDNTIITKKTGTTAYRLVRKVRFFPSGGADKSQRQDITPQDGCVFLVDDRGSVNVYPPTTKFLWQVTENELYRWLDRRLMERESK